MRVFPHRSLTTHNRTLMQQVRACRMMSRLSGCQPQCSLTTRPLLTASRPVAFAAGIKHRARTVARATKQTTQRALRSLKKLRANARYFAATFSSRNPFETVSRR